MPRPLDEEYSAAPAPARPPHRVEPAGEPDVGRPTMDAIRLTAKDGPEQLSLEHVRALGPADGDGAFYPHARARRVLALWTRSTRLA